MCYNVLRHAGQNWIKLANLLEIANPHESTLNIQMITWTWIHTIGILNPQHLIVIVIPHSKNCKTVRCSCWTSFIYIHLSSFTIPQFQSPKKTSSTPCVSRWWYPCGSHSWWRPSSSKDSKGKTTQRSCLWWEWFLGYKMGANEDDFGDGRCLFEFGFGMNFDNWQDISAWWAGRIRDDTNL